MSQASQETVRIISQYLGIAQLNESRFPRIMYDAQNFIQQVVDKAHIFTKVSKRQMLTVNDINMALETLHMEPLLGYTSQQDPQLIETVFSGTSKLFAYEDPQIHVDQYARKEIPKYPVATHNEINWIAVNGSGKENPADNDLSVEKQEPDPALLAGPRQQVQDGDAFVVSNKHQFSFAYKKYFWESRVLLLSEKCDKREFMLSELRTQGCIKMLVPYYIRFSLVQLRDHPAEFPILYTALSTARSLIQNDSLSNLPSYFHSFITIALSFLLSPNIMKNSVLEQIRLRDLAGEFLQVIAEKLGANYPMVQPQITQQLLSVLVDKDASVSEKYGAFVGLSSFGSTTVSEFVLPNVGTIVGDLLQGPMRSGDRDTRTLAGAMYDMIVNAAGQCLHADSHQLALGMPLVAPKFRTEAARTLGMTLLPFYCPGEDLYL